MEGQNPGAAMVPLSGSVRNSGQKAGFGRAPKRRRPFHRADCRSTWSVAAGARIPSIVKAGLIPWLSGQGRTLPRVEAASWSQRRNAGRTDLPELDRPIMSDEEHLLARRRTPVLILRRPEGSPRRRKAP